MAKDYAKSFYNSSAWKKAREAYIAMKFGICERCGKPNSKTVHHKKYITENNINNTEITLNFDNFELLCEDCHNREHKDKYSSTDWNLMFDANGDLIRKPSADKDFIPPY